MFAYGSVQHLLKPKIDKLESRSEVCQFIGYPKRTKSYYIYGQVNKKVFVSINVRFLEKELYDK